MKIKGEWSTRRVWVTDVDNQWKELFPHRSQAVYNHSPDGFNWGYGGSGPSQLALALMLEITDKETALNHYQQLKWDVIAKLPQGDFTIEAEIEDFLDAINPTLPVQ